MHLMRNAVRPYAWGSRTAIATLQGRPVPTPHPEAELWMGAHPDDPSVLLDHEGTDRSLLELVEADPVGQLGVAMSDRWHNRLPFLLKLLAADEPMSMQAHPSAEQAREGFAREEAAGVPRLAPSRNYPDPTPKPELVCALTEFHVLAGFRDPQATLRLLRGLPASGLDRYVDLLAAQPDAGGLRALFTTWITLPSSVLADLLPDVLDVCVQHVREHGEFDLECRTVLELGERYPGDPGVLSALLLNRLVLGPGEAVYLAAGNLHAYLRGTAVEILANSDNILRCGLTPKHVDVPELLRVVDFSHGDMPVLRGEPADEHVLTYPTDAPEFELSRVEWPAGVQGEAACVKLRHAGPQLLVCTQGEVELATAGGAVLRLGCGDSAWLPANDCHAGPVTMWPKGPGPSQLFRATAGTN
ncbi:MAG TPA: mannose-6-phosphate isomerase, class I [Pseudonocardiaceae bacterium]|nr:mannose-6-phosphate isomerase, class I [Pseudonocardiaceae bacterium]